MNDANMIVAMQQMLYFVVAAVCIITIPILLIAIVMSIIQAATQINEMTLTFIPKFIVMFVLLITLSPWMMHKLILLTHQYLDHFPNYIR